MSRIKWKLWWPLLVLAFPLLLLGILYIPPISEWLWHLSEPLRTQHALLTGTSHDLDEYRWLVFRISAWNSLLFCSLTWLVIRFRSTIKERLDFWWNEQVSFGQLAIYRVIVFGGLLALIIQNHPASMNLLPIELQDPPLLWGFIRGTWLLEPDVAAILSLLAQATSIAAIIGFQGSLSGKIAALSSLLVLLIPQSYGKVDHYHLWWWASLIIAWSPAWKVWSVDAWLAASKGEIVERSDTKSDFKGLFWLGLLIITAYFFPGIWKWAWGGPSWATPDSMKAIAWNQWALLSEPPYWKPTSDWMWAVLSGWVLLFELTFPLIILGQKWRKGYIIMAFFFHIGVYLTLGIAFWHLGLLLLLIWPNKNAKGNSVHNNEAQKWKSPWIWVVGAFLFSGLTYFDTWPVGVYPGFSAALSNQVQTITLKNKEEVLWEMYNAQWGVGNRKLNPSRKMGIVTQIARAKGEERLFKLKALRSFLATGPDSLLFTDENNVFNLDLKNSKPYSTN